MGRSYRQHCGLAVALDVTGRRWSLLLVRDLEPGPRRFGQLLEGLPGISTDLLADRLRELEAAGAVTRRTVDGKPQYALTERGRELASICHDLARWGMPLLPPFDETPHRANARWALQTMASNAAPRATHQRIHIEFTDAEPLTMDLGEHGGTLRYGTAGEADVTVRLDTRDFSRLIGWVHGDDGPAPTEVEVDGSPSLLLAALRTAPLTVAERR